MGPTPVRIHIDGAARGNPGPAAYAYVIEAPGQRIEEAARLGRATNNVAEYTALVRALERAAELGLARLDIKSDSELLVRQMNGEYRVKSPDLQELYQEARGLCQRFESVSIQHVPRSANARADELCNLALDGLLPAASRAAPPPKAAPANRALACLEEAARAWARGDPADPPPAQILDQLRAILRKTT